MSKLILMPYFEDSKCLHLALRNCSVYLILRSLVSGMGIWTSSHYCDVNYLNTLKVSTRTMVSLSSEPPSGLIYLYYIVQNRAALAQVGKNLCHGSTLLSTLFWRKSWFESLDAAGVKARSVVAWVNLLAMENCKNGFLWLYLWTWENIESMFCAGIVVEHAFWNSSVRAKVWGQFIYPQLVVIPGGFRCKRAPDHCYEEGIRELQVPKEVNTWRQKYTQMLITCRQESKRTG